MADRVKNIIHNVQEANEVVHEAHIVQEQQIQANEQVVEQQAEVQLVSNPNHNIVAFLGYNYSDHNHFDGIIHS